MFCSAFQQWAHLHLRIVPSSLKCKQSCPVTSTDHPSGRNKSMLEDGLLCFSSKTPERRAFNYTTFRHSEIPQPDSWFRGKCTNVCILLYLWNSYCPMSLHPLFQSPVIIPIGFLWDAGAVRVWVLLSVFCEYNLQHRKGSWKWAQANLHPQKFCFLPWYIFRINNWYSMGN